MFGFLFGDKKKDDSFITVDHSDANDVAQKDKSAMDKARAAFEDAEDRIEDTAENIKEHAEEFGDRVEEKAEEAGETIKEKFDSDDEEENVEDESTDGEEEEEENVGGEPANDLPEEHEEEAEDPVEEETLEPGEAVDDEAAFSYDEEGGEEEDENREYEGWADSFTSYDEEDPEDEENYVGYTFNDDGEAYLDLHTPLVEEEDGEVQEEPVEVAELVGNVDNVDNTTEEDPALFNVEEDGVSQEEDEDDALDDEEYFERYFSEPDSEEASDEEDELTDEEDLSEEEIDALLEDLTSESISEVEADESQDVAPASDKVTVEEVFDGEPTPVPYSPEFFEEHHEDLVRNRNHVSPLIVLVDEDKESLGRLVQRYVGDSKAYLVDLSKNRDGFKVLGDNIERSFITIDGEEEDFNASDISYLVAREEGDRRPFIIVTGIPDISVKVEEQLRDNPVALGIINDRICEVIAQAKEYGVTILVAAENTTDMMIDVINEVVGELEAL